MNEIALREAKAKLSQLVDAAERGETTIITRHGRPVAELTPVDARKARLRGKTLMDVLRAIPGDLEIERDQTPMREVDF